VNVKPLIYVAGPLSKGVVSQNIRRATLVGNELAHMGYGVFIPHLNCLWEMIAGGQDYEFWLDQDMQVLYRCDLLFALDGESPGRDREVAFIKEELKRPIIYTMEEAKAWIEEYAEIQEANRGE
jgi:hypothetical protein